MSETEKWPFLRLLRMNSSEMKYRSTQNERIELAAIIGLIMYLVQVLRVSTFATELDLTG